MTNAKKLDCTWPKARLEPRRLRVADDYLQGVLDGKSFLVFDGAMGTQLQARGLAAGELPELLCLTNPEEVTQIHAAYVAAGEFVVVSVFGSVLFRQIIRNEAERLGQPCAAELRSGVSDANTIAQEDIPVVDGMGPTGNGDHSDREYMVRRSLPARTLLAACSILRIWEEHSRSC